MAYKQDGSELDTIEKYTAKLHHRYQMAREAEKRSGVACPECGVELAWMQDCVQRNMDVLRLARCLSCGFEKMLEI